MKQIWKVLQCLIIVVFVLSSAGTVFAAPGAPKGEGEGDYQTGFVQWRGKSGGFEGPGWEFTGVVVESFRLPDGTEFGPALGLAPSGLMTGTDTAGIYNGGDYEYGEATSPVVVLPAGFAMKEAIVSWNAATQPGTWIEIQARARLGGSWSKWYSMGVWASGTETVTRHSISGQGDASGWVAIDTLVLSKKIVAADALQVKARLFRAADSGTASPVIRNLSLAYSTETPKKAASNTPGDPANWNTLLDMPECSQMVYPDGGNVWCSPTSTSMVLGYWGIDPGPCEQRVRAAVAGVYDANYDGHGNWPFNTAYAASRGPLEGYVVRYNSISHLEKWVKAGVPVVMSIAWGKKELTGAPIPSSSGHLVVLVGFDASGNPIVNDPAASADADVQRTYLRGELEAAWITNSGGTVYLIYPEGHAVPGF